MTQVIVTLMAQVLPVYLGPINLVGRSIKIKLDGL